MEIYIADIGALPYYKLAEKCLILPKARREQIAKYQMEADKKRGIAAGLLLEYGCNRQGLTLREDIAYYRKVTLGRRKNGKPYLNNTKECCFNLSHSGAYVALVIAKEEAGIDVEREKNADTGLQLAHRFFMRQEYEILKGLKEQEAWREFTRLWTRKESYLKAVGTGLLTPMDSFCVLGDMVGEYYLKSWEMQEGYFLSVCAKEEISGEPQKVILEV